MCLAGGRTVASRLGIRITHQEGGMRSTCARISCLLLSLAALVVMNRPVAAGGSLFEALRRNDVAAVKALAGNADVNEVDATGATPLMYAAFYSGPDAIRALLDQGAAIDAVNSFGASALMWAAGQPANVQLLLERGAAVNARANNGWTPLVAATRLGN